MPFPPGTRVIVCDDDSVVRALITDLVEDRSGQVLAETSRSWDAIALIERFAPDLVVLDLSLDQSMGKDVVDFVAGRDHRPDVIIFTAYDGDVDERQDFVRRVVRKPDFEALEHSLDEWPLSEPSAYERRRPTREVAAPVARSDRGLDEPDDFYRILADADPRDTMLRISLDGLEAETPGFVRRTIRVQDRLLQRGGAVTALLIGGGAEAPAAVRGRLRSTISDIDDRSTTCPTGDDPIGAFVALDEAGRGSEPGRV